MTTVGARSDQGYYGRFDALDRHGKWTVDRHPRRDHSALAVKELRTTRRWPAGNRPKVRSPGQAKTESSSHMNDYTQEFERRIVQFADFLKKMYHRAHEEVHGPCFMIFEAARLPLERVVTRSDDAGSASVTPTERPSHIKLPDEGWKEDESQARFIQFSFEEKWFCLDMPLQTLYRAEAEQILRFRKEFFYLTDKPQFTLTGEDVDGYDPFRKVYAYGDESSAAEDMAFIFFQVWRFPVDWRLSVKAAAFGGKKTNWERGTPIK